MAEYRARDVSPEKQFMAVLQDFWADCSRFLNRYCSVRIGGIWQTKTENFGPTGAMTVPSITKLSVICSSVANGNSN